MPKKGTKEQPYVHYHKDGSIWAEGKMRNGKSSGYWEWFRKDGTRLRSGHFENGVQVGDWTTYDKKGAVYKVTTIKKVDGPRNARGRGDGDSSINIG